MSRTITTTIPTTGALGSVAADLGRAVALLSGDLTPADGLAYVAGHVAAARTGDTFRAAARDALPHVLSVTFGMLDGRKAGTLDGPEHGPRLVVTASAANVAALREATGLTAEGVGHYAAAARWYAYLSGAVETVGKRVMVTLGAPTGDDVAMAAEAWKRATGRSATLDAHREATKVQTSAAAIANGPEVPTEVPAAEVPTNVPAEVPAAEVPAAEVPTEIGAPTGDGAEVPTEVAEVPAEVQTDREAYSDALASIAAGIARLQSIRDSGYTPGKADNARLAAAYKGMGAYIQALLDSAKK